MPFGSLILNPRSRLMYSRMTSSTSLLRRRGRPCFQCGLTHIRGFLLARTMAEWLTEVPCSLERACAIARKPRRRLSGAPGASQRNLTDPFVVMNTCRAPSLWRSFVRCEDLTWTRRWRRAWHLQIRLALSGKTRLFAWFRMTARAPLHQGFFPRFVSHDIQQDV